MGVGTPTPSATLEVNGNIKTAHLNIDGSVDPRLYITKSGANRVVLGDDTHGILGLHDSAANQKVYLSSGGDSFFNSGNVGIGTTSPSEIFHIKKSVNNHDMPMVESSGTEAGWQLKNTGPGGKIWQIMSTGGSAGAGPGKLQFYNLTDTVTGMTLDEKGNVGIGTTNQFGNGEGILSLKNANTNPSMTLMNAAALYASSGELFAYDAAGNATQISPHDKETGEWIFYSKNIKTGRVVKINMEKLVKKFEEMTGESFIEEWVEER